MGYNFDPDISHLQVGEITQLLTIDQTTSLVTALNSFAACEGSVADNNGAIASIKPACFVWHGFFFDTKNDRQKKNVGSICWESFC